MRAHILTIVLSLAIAPGCVLVSDFGAFYTADGSIADAGPVDAPLRDGSLDASRDAPPSDAADAPPTDAPMGCSPSCGASEECCSGTCTDVTSDLANCGACGMTCEDATHATASCMARDCTLACDDDYDDCDAAPGCETSLTTISDCGMCGRGCAAGEICGAIAGVYDCRSSCPMGETNCSGTCADLGSDPRHCGSCSMVCDERPGSAERCEATGCAYECDMGRADCDGDLSVSTGNGCETVLVLQYPDADSDGYGSPLAAGTLRCPGPALSPLRTDCDDTAPTRSPALAESCDGVDNDCNEVIDDGFLLSGMLRTVGDDCTCASGAASARIVCMGTSAVACAYPTETCNGADDDCAGGADDTFACVRGSMATCLGTGVGGCRFTGISTCTGSCAAGACMPPAETCDAVDQNCDGFVDDGRVPFGAPVMLTGSSGWSGIHAAFRSAADGGALVASGSGIRENLLFVRFDGTGAPVGTPLVIDTHPMYALIGDVGWDGTQWVVMYTKFNDTRGVSEALRVHISATDVITRPAGTVADADSVSIASSPGSSSLGIVTARFAGAGGMQTGTYASGAFTRPMSTLVSSPILSRAFATPAPSGGYYAVGADATGVFYQAFDTSGAIGTLRRPIVAAGTDVFSAAWDGTRLVLLYRDGMVRLRGIDAGGTTVYTRDVRIAGWLGTVEPIDGDLWVSFTDGTALRARATDGVLFPESYPHYCEAFSSTPGAAARGLCFSGVVSRTLGRCP